MTMSKHSRIAFGILVVLGALAACGGGDDGASDSAAGTASPTTSTTDTLAGGMAGMPGMDHAMNRPAAKDADHEFLRMMTDHHQGLIQMATAAMGKGSTQAVQGDAHRLHTKQQEEQKRMIEMVQRDYGEALTPMVMGANNTMLDQLQSRTGADYDRTFYGNVVAHHRAGIRMIDQFASRLNKPEVRQMADRMKADQQKEITEFEAKARG